MKLPQPKHFRWLQAARVFVEEVAHQGLSSTRELRSRIVDRKIEISDVTFTTQDARPCLKIQLEDGSTWICFAELDVLRKPT